MALLPVHKYFIRNGELLPNDVFIASENDGGIYEVLRVMEGKPLFMEEHLERLYHSAEIAGHTIPYSSSEVEQFLIELIQHNQVDEGNILVSCKKNLKIFFIAHSYPTNEQYVNGVVCGILHAERENPNAKVFQTTVREKANRLISAEGFYEVLLVDHELKITEGSRSNVFFIRENRILTPPAGKVLLGITRQRVISCATGLGITIGEEEINLQELSAYSTVFITGTSPKILPVYQILNQKFDVNHPLLRRLMKRYDEMIHSYIHQK
jgi:branched-chain amino acid aminotransferase